ncbi:hypothetical protein N8T08_002693 [Aspergillus melleus]|uniref:Uncharacterized protein n=1 Tax=Aspergillus melleus TaxID=138277 RepID=A0ACC3B8R2_9EURO|nr:hypothetical protein N8T08_002693 [Aspergillus melleus]
MSDSWNDTMENLAIALTNERIADTEEDPFHLSNEMEDLSLDDVPPAHTEHEVLLCTNLSPVDYAEGRGEWRELDILPQYTPENLERIMQDVYNEYMGDSMHDSDQQGDGEHQFDEIELIPGYTAVNDYLDTLPDPAVFEVNDNSSQVHNGDTGSETLDPLPDPAVFGANGSSPQAQNGNTRSETVEDESDQLPEPTPPGTHTESSGTDQVDDSNGSNGASDPANGHPSGQAPSENTTVGEPAHYETGSIPELVVTDYDNDHPLVSRQPDRSGLPNGHHFIDLDCSTEVLSEADSFLELRRMRGNRNRPSGTHTDRNGVGGDIETSSDPLVNQVESFATLVTTNSHGFVVSEVRERDTSQSEAPVSLSEALVNGTGIISDLINPIRLIPLEEAPEDEESFDPFHPENEGLTMQGPVNVPRHRLPRWSWNNEAMPGYEVFVDSLSPGEFDVTNDWNDSQQGRFGDQGDDDDIPWDARPLMYFDLAIRTRDETPRTPLSPISNVFEDLAVALDDGEVIEYGALPEGNISEHEAQEAGMTTEWCLPADEVVTVAGW